MVVDAFIYMYVVAFGASLGVGTTVLIGWKVYKRSKKNDKKPSFVR